MTGRGIAPALFWERASLQDEMPVKNIGYAQPA